MPCAVQIVPELTSSSVDELPILKADALKFLTILRSQLPIPVLLAAFGNLVALLASDSNVVHTYAAIAIERLLASKVYMHSCSLAYRHISCFHLRFF